jgi:hypothetical protein
MAMRKEEPTVDSGQGGCVVGPGLLWWSRRYMVCTSSQEMWITFAALILVCYIHGRGRWGLIDVDDATCVSDFVPSRTMKT